MDPKKTCLPPYQVCSTHHVRGDRSGGLVVTLEIVLLALVREFESHRGETSHFFAT